jgi:hypothetical protein
VLLLRLQREGHVFDYFGVRTAEGNGVIHLAIRLRSKNRLEAKILRAHWLDIHKSPQLRIERVKSKDDLARYLQEQGTRTKRRRHGVAYEIARQDYYIAQMESRKWVFPGWRKVFRSHWSENWLNGPGQAREEWDKLMKKEREELNYA